MADRDMVSRAEVLDIYAELYDEFDDAPGVIKVLHKVCDKLKSLQPLELLKEQKARKPIFNEQKYGDHLPHCGNCEKVLPNNGVYGKVNFCHYCGQAVKWDDQT